MSRLERRQRHRDHEYTDEIAGEREAATRRVRARRHFTATIVSFVVISAGLVAIWAASGAGYFWPAWVIAIGGVLLLRRWWRLFGRRPITEGDIDAEMKRRQR